MILTAREMELINKMRTIINSIDTLLKAGITKESAIKELTEELRFQSVKLEIANRKN